MAEQPMNWKKMAILVALLAISGVGIYLIIALSNTDALHLPENDVKGNGFGPGEQDWDFVTVREGAHMFWWLYYTTAEVEAFTDRPLAIWLQGGPGSSSTGYGNFEEFGPLDLELKERNFTWVKDMNVLFLDSPVGAGFSYVDDAQYLNTDNAQIVVDLVEVLKGFYLKHPEFESVPLHIFSESYGGKVAVEFAYVLDKEIKENKINCPLLSVTSVDGWISPIDSMWSWAPFLLHMGFVDQVGHDAIMASTQSTLNEMEAGNFVNATNLWGRTERVIDRVTGGIDFYNVLRAQHDESRLLKELNVQDINRLMYNTLVRHSARASADPLDDLMTGAVSEALNIPEHVVWGSQSSITFDTLAGDFMKPTIEYVERLLTETDIEVHIITGQLDLIVATPGTVEWVKKLQWPNAAAYVASPRSTLVMNGIIEGYYKQYEKFSMYWINRAGHMVPFDNPPAMDYILRKVTKYNAV